MSRIFRRVGLFVIALTAIAHAGCHEELGLESTAPSTQIEVERVTFVGVDSFDTSRIESLLATRDSSWLPWGKKHYFDRATFAADLDRIRAFYRDQGFPDAEVTSFDIDLSPDGDSVALTVRVSEGEPIRLAGIDFVGFDTVLPGDVTAALRSSIGLTSGEPVGTPEVLRARDVAADALKNHGYPDADVHITRHELAPRRVALVFNADPGERAYFGRIEIAGNTSVDDEIIRRQVLYRPGDPYSRKVIVESQRRLAALDLFEFVNIEAVDRGTIPAEVPTRITVTEGKPRRLSFALGYGTEEKLTGEASLEHVNFLGGARTLGAHAKWSWLDRGVEGHFVQPYFFRPDLTLSLRGRGWYVDEPGFRARSQGGQATVGYARGGAFSSGLTFMHEFESSRIANDALRDLSLRDKLIALGLNPTTGVQDGVLSAIVLDVEHTTAANLLDAHQGHRLSAHIEQGGGWLPGSFNYYNLLGEARLYATPLGSVTLAQRIRYGSIEPMGPDSDVPFFKRYFLGGSTSLRGWGRYEVSPLSGSGLPIGGHALFESSSEVRVPLFGNLSGVAFLDAGNVWTRSWDFHPDDLLFDAGPGLRYQTPLGPVRLDLAYQLTRLHGLLIDGKPEQRHWRIHFSIGQAF